MLENASHNGNNPALSVRAKAFGLAGQAMSGDVEAQLLKIGWSKVRNCSRGAKKPCETLSNATARLKRAWADFAGLDFLELVVEIVVTRVLDREAPRV
jgi:hypothetical protein